MSGDPMKKDFPRDDFCAFLRSKIERSLVDGSDPKTVGVYINMLGLYESEDDPEFYADLFYGYYKEGLMTYRAAALAGLHAFLAAPTKHPFKAIEEGHIDVEIAVDERGMARVPAWILQGLFEGIHNYLTHTSASLNQAFQITGGKKGPAKLRRPLRDLDTTEFLLASRFSKIVSGEKPSKLAAAAELEEWVASHSKDGSTQGYNERSSRDAFKRIRRAFAALD